MKTLFYAELPYTGQSKKFQSGDTQDINWNGKFLQLKLCKLLALKESFLIMVSPSNGFAAFLFFPRQIKISSDCYHQSCYSHDVLCPLVPSGITQKQHLCDPVSELTRLRLNHRALLFSFMVKDVQTDLFQDAFTSTTTPHLLPLAPQFKKSHPGTEGFGQMFVQTKTMQLFISTVTIKAPTAPSPPPISSLCCVLSLQHSLCAADLNCSPAHARPCNIRQVGKMLSSAGTCS